MLYLLNWKSAKYLVDSSGLCRRLSCDFIKMQTCVLSSFFSCFLDCSDQRTKGDTERDIERERERQRNKERQTDINQCKPVKLVAPLSPRDLVVVVGEKQ